ncbi:trypsin-like peptidase domain-containing protein [Kitasatospora aureofaciens]|uniref:nSTAND1 domain-containing NTPase n=1 Tax=Kitasatospora aureofaciens TaxID=1894 RepID=UPI0033A4F657
MPALLSAVAQVLGPDGELAGAGFLVDEDALVSCAHVVRAAGAGSGERVQLVFPHVEGMPRVGGHVLTEAWRAPEGDDVAVIRLDSTTAGMTALPLGSSAGCRGHQVRSFGFPAQAPPGGHFGFGVAGDLLPATEGRGVHLQLTAANDLTTGFSGGPVLDEVTGLVIGMLTEITGPDEYERGQGIAYVTPTQVLRDIWPELALQDVCPYRGLEPFTAEHAQWFEGRKEAVRQVLASLGRQRRLTLLLGPSGSGKSSLIQAGVLPALARGELPGSDMWLPVIARPRQNLPAELERAGLPGATTEGIAAAVTRRLAADPTHQRVVLVIDQFEEFLVPSTNGQQQDRLAVTDQLAAAADSVAQLSVILVMRDDFYPQLAAWAPKLLEAALPGLLNLPAALSRDDLCDIIALPAQDVGVRFESGLPERIITDVLATTAEGTATGQAPVTVLPLLELALSQLWQRRKDGYLTHEAYQRTGAVTGSLTTWCDSALNRLPHDQLPIAQRILTSLVRPAEPGYQIPAIREQLPLQELRELASNTNTTPDSDRTIDVVVAALTRHRIITTYTPRTREAPDVPGRQPVAELIHDALIRDWGTLREWVDQDHRFQEWLATTRRRHAGWAESGDPGDLLGGTGLAEGLEWAQQRHLPHDISAYLTASRQRQQAGIRRSRRLNTILATVLALTLVATAGALWQWRTAVTQRQAALSRQLAGQSNTLISPNPDLASLLAIVAYRTSRTPESVESLENAAASPLQRRLLGHNNYVNSVAFSPDGRTLAAASGDKAVLLWDAATGATRTPLTGHTAAVSSVAFSPDGRTLATGSGDQTVRLWDVATGTTRTTLTGHTSTVFSVAFSPDGRTLAAGGGDQTVRLWDVATGTTRTTLTGHTSTVFSVAFSPDGRTLAAGGGDQTVRLWDVATGTTRTTLTGHTSAVNSVAFSPDGHTLATGSGDQTVRLWDVATGTTRTTLTGHTSTVFSVAFSPDRSTLAAGGGDGSVRLWDMDHDTTRAILTGHTDDVSSVAFSPDGRTLATGSHDQTVRLWDVATGTTLTGHTAAVSSVAFSPDGRTLATGSGDHTVRLWDVTTRTTRTTLTGHTDVVSSVAFAPDGHTLATGGGDGSVRLWDMDHDTASATLIGDTDAVNSVAFSHNGHTLATGNAVGTMRLWDVTTGKNRVTATDQTEGVFSVAFSPDDRTLAAGGTDGTVRLWNAATGAPRTPLTGHAGTVYSVAFSPDGRTLATGSRDHTVRLWDVVTGTTRTTLTGHTSAVNSVAFSPDGHTLATGSADGTVRLWDVTTGKSRATLTSRIAAVYSVAFSPDGHTLAIGSADGTVRLKNAVLPQPTEAIQKICRAVNRDLTLEERAAYLAGQSTGHVCPAG